MGFVVDLLKCSIFCSLEQRLAKRKAKVAELKQKQEEVKINAKAEGKENTKEVQSLVSKLNFNHCSWSSVGEKTEPGEVLWYRKVKPPITYINIGLSHNKQV